MSTNYQLAPIDADTAAALRAAGGERYVADSMPGYPCRQCLRDADLGDTLILVSHDPFDHDSPYRSPSPIFLHEHPCTPDDTTDQLPQQLTRRQLSVRAFDARSMMIDAQVIDGAGLDRQLRHFFSNAATAEIHVHNASRGCWATTVVRRA